MCPRESLHVSSVRQFAVLRGRIRNKVAVFLNEAVRLRMLRVLLFAP
jgi:hypothetical protein